LAHAVAEVPQLVAIGQEHQPRHCSEGSVFGQIVIEKLRKVDVRSDWYRPALLDYESRIALCLLDVVLDISRKSGAHIDFLHGITPRRHTNRRRQSQRS